MWQKGIVLVGSLALVVLLPAPARSQSTYGVIVGAVTDPTGAIVIGASVTVTNTETNIGKTVATSADGAYEATHLLPGRYSVRVEAAGFETVRRDEVVVESRSTVCVDFQLALGSTSTEIQVVATTR